MTLTGIRQKQGKAQIYGCICYYYLSILLRVYSNHRDGMVNACIGLLWCAKKAIYIQLWPLGTIEVEKSIKGAVKKLRPENA